MIHKKYRASTLSANRAAIVGKDAIYNSLFQNMEESVLILGDHTGLPYTTLTHAH